MIPVSYTHLDVYKRQVHPVAEGRKEYEVLVRTHAKSPVVKLTDVGVGVSQVLPALVQAFYSPPNLVVWMEQPEIHLHPSAQANLADAFISAVQSNENGSPRGTQLIIETHSEHFLTRLQRRVAERRIEATDVAVYFVKREGANAVSYTHLDVYKRQGGNTGRSQSQPARRYCNASRRRGTHAGVRVRWSSKRCRSLNHGQCPRPQTQ